jgi:hypothetical protein
MNFAQFIQQHKMIGTTVQRKVVRTVRIIRKPGKTDRLVIRCPIKDKMKEKVLAGLLSAVLDFRIPDSIFSKCGSGDSWISLANTWKAIHIFRDELPQIPLTVGNMSCHSFVHGGSTASAIVGVATLALEGATVEMDIRKAFDNTLITDGCWTFIKSYFGRSSVRLEIISLVENFVKNEFCYVVDFKPLGEPVPWPLIKNQFTNHRVKSRFYQFRSGQCLQGSALSPILFILRLCFLFGDVDFRLHCYGDNLYLLEKYCPSLETILSSNGYTGVLKQQFVLFEEKSTLGCTFVCTRTSIVIRTATHHSYLRALRLMTRQIHDAGYRMKSSVVRRLLRDALRSRSADSCKES